MCVYVDVVRSFCGCWFTPNRLMGMYVQCVCVCLDVHAWFKCLEMIVCVCVCVCVHSLFTYG